MSWITAFRNRGIRFAVVVVAASIGIAAATGVGSAPIVAQHYTVEAGDTYRSIATKFGLSETALACANRTSSSACPSVTADPGVGRIIHLSASVATTTTTRPVTTTTIATTITTVAPTTTTVAPTTTSSTTTTTMPAGSSFTENFASATALTDRFDHGWAGEWNAGALFNDAANDWQADHDMMCMNPNTTSRTIHLTSQQQANDAAFFPCMFAGDAAKSHMMTTVNTEGYVTVWFSPKQTFTNVNRVCWDQNITWEGGGKWVIVNFLTSAEYSGQTDLGYTSPDFPKGQGLVSSPQGAAQNGVKVFAGALRSYTNGVFNGQVNGVTVTDKAARYQHCVIDNGNGTLTLSIAQPDGTTTMATVPGNIPDGAIRVEFADDNYNNDKHFYNPEQPVVRNSTGLYTWHWDNVVIG